MKKEDRVWAGQLAGDAGQVGHDTEFPVSAPPAETPKKLRMRLPKRRHDSEPMSIDHGENAGVRPGPHLQARDATRGWRSSESETEVRCREPQPVGLLPRLFSFGNSYAELRIRITATR